MNKTLLTTITIAVFTAFAFSQNYTQTVRGTVTDSDSKLPLAGTSIVIIGTNPIVGTTTDVNGNFKLDRVPIGRIALQLLYMGYESKTITDIVVNSGKEVVLDLSMQESVLTADEIVVTALKNKGEAINDMSLISTHSLSTDETKRYSAGMDDPSRVVSNLAGVTNTPDGSSDIIVRGNSPKYMQWRLDGVEITSPYHFDDQNASFGALSSLNNNLLLASDFYTGAFSPEYGNVLSSVFDVRLRSGNNEKFEATVGFGLIGTDITLEGPFRKDYSGSYLINYRYSTASLIQDVGLINVDGLFNFQDATIKLMLPTRSFGTFSMFGIGGFDNFSIEDNRASMFATPNNQSLEETQSEDIKKNNYMLNTGINHMLLLNKNSFVKTSLSFSSNGIDDEDYLVNIIELYDNQGEFLRDSIASRQLDFDNSYRISAYRLGILYNGKLNANHRIDIGSKYALYNYKFKQRTLNADDSLFTVVDFDENVALLQNFITWKYRMNESVTFVTGLHYMNVLLNHKNTIEPRVAIEWKLNSSNSIHAGYGKHSTMENIQHYFAIVEREDGSVIEPNKDLDLLKAHHYVLGYKKRFTENWVAKIEAYYQDLYNLPVENNDTSYFATINEGINYRYVDLVNKGTGKNYGIELTVERYFNKDYYVLVNTTLYNSKYKSLEGVERNTRYNQNYLANILCGKEFRKLGKKKNQTFSVNCKLVFQGGRKYIPLLRDGNGNLAVDADNNRYWDYKRAYDDYIDNIYSINLSVSYKYNRLHSTHEIFLDLQNITNQTSRIEEFYDGSEKNSVGHLKQFGFFPNLMYRIYF